MGVLKGYKGFTLIELLVSMAVLGIILAVIAQAFSLGHSSWERGEKVMMESLHLRTVADLLSKQLRSTFPLVTRNNEKDENILHFSGDAQSLRFVSTLPFGTRRRGGLFRINYSLEPGSAGRSVLIVDQRPAYEKEIPGGSSEMERGVVLLSDLIEASWAYSDGEDWQESWNKEEHDRLPEKVRLTLRYPQGKKVQVQEMVFPLQVKFKLEEGEGFKGGIEAS